MPRLSFHLSSLSSPLALSNRSLRQSRKSRTWRHEFRSTRLAGERKIVSVERTRSLESRFRERRPHLEACSTSSSIVAPARFGFLSPGASPLLFRGKMSACLDGVQTAFTSAIARPVNGRGLIGWSLCDSHTWPKCHSLDEPPITLGPRWRP